MALNSWHLRSVPKKTACVHLSRIMQCRTQSSLVKLVNSFVGLRSNLNLKQATLSGISTVHLPRILEHELVSTAIGTLAIRVPSETIAKTAVFTLEQWRENSDTYHSRKRCKVIVQCEWSLSFLMQISQSNLKCKLSDI